ncbi:Trp-rich small protein [Staphylococcus pseudintermedius]
MSWTEFWMLVINGGILIIFRCWVESKWRRRDQEKQQKDDSTHT